jgi:SNW domain-containing protein 1
VQGKITASRPVSITKESLTTAGKDKYINYTPSDAAPGKMAGKQRIIRMVEMAVDPLEPPKFKHKKVPGGPGSPPVPIMHSPPRKLTVKDQQAWKIPPVVSNWKNAKGYTIPLDKRLAADGRTLQQATINDKFATLSEALYVAERKARAEVEMRAEMQKRMMMKEKEQQEAKLRDLAARAREERAGLSRIGEPAASGKRASAPQDSDEEEEEVVRSLCFYCELSGRFWLTNRLHLHRLDLASQRPNAKRACSVK